MASSSSTSPYSVIYAFGDSLSDAGNVSIFTSIIGSEPVSPPYYTETYGSSSATVFSNGPVAVQDLSLQLGLGTLAPSLDGGNDFAYGGAETGSTPQNSGNVETTALSLPFQLTQFGLQHPHPSPTALYTISIGGNDIFDILSNTGLSAAQQAIDVTDAVNNEYSDILQLASDGAKNLLVFNVPDLGDVPEVTFGLANGSDHPSAATDALASSLSSMYNAELASDLTTAAAKTGMNIQTADLYDFTNSIYTDPSAYSINSVNVPVWSGNFTSQSSGTLSSTNVATQDQSLFWDDFHPTASVHAMAANLARSLVAPAIVYEEDTTTGATSIQQASPYYGLDTDLHSEFTSITPDNVALFASTSGAFLSSGAGNDILVANSGNNVLAAGGGSNFLVGGTGNDTFFADGTGNQSTWNAILNFHAGDVLSVAGYQPGVSKIAWLPDDGTPNSGAVLQIDLKGNGTLFANDTFLGISQATASSYVTSTGTSGSTPYLAVQGV